jgi:hypothetical protein
MPNVEAPEGYIPPERLVLSTELHDRVRNHLTERCLLGCDVRVRQPLYTWLSITANLRVAADSERALHKDLGERAEAKLYRYLNPYKGGPDGKGWPFGRHLHESEIHSLLRGLPHVEFVEHLEIKLGEPGSAAPLTVAPPHLVLPRDGVVCSLEHHIKVEPNGVL